MMMLVVLAVFSPAFVFRLVGFEGAGARSTGIGLGAVSAWVVAGK